MLREISSQDRLCGATSLWTSIAVSTKYYSAFLKYKIFLIFTEKSTHSWMNNIGSHLEIKLSLHINLEPKQSVQI